MITDNTQLYVFRGDTALRDQVGSIFNSLAFSNDGVAEDVTNVTIYLTVKENLADTYAAAKIAKTYTNAVDPETGIINIPLAESDTSTLDPKEYFYDIEYRESTTVITLFKGKFFIIEDITNP